MGLHTDLCLCLKTKALAVPLDLVVRSEIFKVQKSSTKTHQYNKIQKEKNH